jgi:hypothetical protein
MAHAARRAVRRVRRRHCSDVRKHDSPSCGPGCCVPLRLGGGGGARSHAIGSPESKQPYHAVETLCVAEAAQRLQLYRAQAETIAHSALHQLSVDLAAQGYRVGSAGILESSGRKAGSLGSILNSHALIHSADGDHFRNALAAAALRMGLAVHRVPARDLDARAESDLRRPLSELTSIVLLMGRHAGPPWGADQKQAALLAWLLLETNR